MSDVLLSLWTLLVFLVIGFTLVRTGITSPTADRGLSKLVFYACTPALMFTAVSQADPGEVFSLASVVNIGTAVILALTYYFIAPRFLGVEGGARTVGALCASYVNAGNIGVAYLLAVVGDATASAPVILFQIVVMVPISFTLLDRQTNAGGGHVVRRILKVFSQPLFIGVLAALAVSVTGVHVPAMIGRPVEMLAAVAVPVMMIATGISLATARMPQLNRDLAPLAGVFVFRVLLSPLLAFGLAKVIGLEGDALLAVMVVSTFPVANNVFAYAHRYEAGVVLARDSLLITLLMSMPMLVLITAIFHN